MVTFTTTIHALLQNEVDEETVQEYADSVDFSDMPEDPSLVEGAESTEQAQFLELARRQSKQVVAQAFETDPEVFEVTVEVENENE